MIFKRQTALYFLLIDNHVGNLFNEKHLLFSQINQNSAVTILLNSVSTRKCFVSGAYFMFISTELKYNRIK